MLLLHPCKINFLYVMFGVGEWAGRHGLLWFFRLQTQSSILGERRKEENRQMHSEEVIKRKSLHWPRLRSMYWHSHPSRSLHQDRLPDSLYPRHHKTSRYFSQRLPAQNSFLFLRDCLILLLSEFQDYLRTLVWSKKKNLFLLSYLRGRLDVCSKGFLVLFCQPLLDAKFDKQSFHYSAVNPINLSLKCNGLKMLDFKKPLISIQGFTIVYHQMTDFHTIVQV